MLSLLVFCMHLGMPRFYIEIMYHLLGQSPIIDGHVEAQSAITVVTPASIAFGILLVFVPLRHDFGHLDVAGEEKRLSLSQNVLDFAHYFDSLALLFLMVDTAENNEKEISNTVSVLSTEYLLVTVY